MKLVCAGMQKTGTKSMAAALRILGYIVHDVFEQYFLEKELWNKVRSNTATVEDYKRILDSVDAVTDYLGCIFWEQILEAFPDTKVILSVRSSEDEWCHSAVRHFKKMDDIRPVRRSIMPDSVLDVVLGPTMRDYQEHANTFCCACIGAPSIFGEPVEAMLRIKYRQHNAYVKANCPKDQLLIFNVKEGWGPLCRFLNVPEPDVPFPHQNVKSEIVQQAASGEFNDLGLSNTIRKEASTRLALIFLIVAAIVTHIYSNCIGAPLS